jgi:hypothetical protein
MSRNSRIGNRAFTIVVCDDGAGTNSFSVADALRVTIRRSAHGMMIIGDSTGAPFTSLLFQQCSKDRVSTAPTLWIGPVDGESDAEVVSAWIEGGIWDADLLPARLRSPRDWMSEHTRRT